MNIFKRLFDAKHPKRLERYINYTLPKLDVEKPNVRLSKIKNYYGTRLMTRKISIGNFIYGGKFIQTYANRLRAEGEQLNYYIGIRRIR